MGMTKAIKIALVKRGDLSNAELARRAGYSPQTLYSKMKRDDFCESELREIAAALGLKVDIAFIDPETGERVV